MAKKRVKRSGKVKAKTAKKAKSRAKSTKVKTTKKAKLTRQNKSINYVHMDVPEDKAFFCCDGATIKNIRELEESLEKMPDDIYNYHCNQEKNDFARWIHDVMGETKLAEKLIHKNKNEARLEVVKHIIKNI